MNHRQQHDDFLTWNAQNQEANPNLDIISHEAVFLENVCISKFVFIFLMLNKSSLWPMDLNVPIDKPLLSQWHTLHFEVTTHKSSAHINVQTTLLSGSVIGKNLRPLCCPTDNRSSGGWCTVEVKWPWRAGNSCVGEFRWRSFEKIIKLTVTLHFSSNASNFLDSRIKLTFYA